jgi:hypothetical protein
MFFLGLVVGAVLALYATNLKKVNEWVKSKWPKSGGGPGEEVVKPKSGGGPGEERGNGKP